MAAMQLAYTTFEIRHVKEASATSKRTFTGIASTITTDRMDDVCVPRGARFKLPLPLIWQHDRRAPIGWVRAARVSDKSIEVDCEVHDEKDAGRLKDRLDEAWQQMRAGLVGGLSIGFNPLKWSYIENSQGVEYQEWEWLELSPVLIPANQDASITSIKSIDMKTRAAALASAATREKGNAMKVKRGDVRVAVRGTALHIDSQTKGRLVIQLGKTGAQVLAAGLRQGAGAITKDDSHLAELADLVLADEVLPAARKTVVVRLGK